ncbi:NPC intracellular cholesterol transporter 2 homolog a [Schistocerca piceifrons]|uniref:NPC intracellular cholesterol transporter 2 homolog a n=1 Tax=Schistocerca piceifrons TaxID=274613 RepID=UPI001F5F516A|nr:NPC intracellular cholesterol transporter 2 homolog a [Schistocerca piceifrons]
MARFVALMLAALLPAMAAATAVKHCGTDSPYEDVNEVLISGCQQGTCKLKKKTEVGLEFKFTPSEDIKQLKNRVYAELLTLPFPFAGVDGTSACDQVFDASGQKAGCPLKAGQEYVYKNKLKVLDIYPKIRVLVHWELQDQNEKTLKCFEVPARITS